MYLKKIEIAGFKSFADRTVIEFDQGLTAVVGPNGSGKSNITEAIRWVLGEQSAKNLRGGRMPDVIFSGSAKRKPLNIAEVTLVLDNEQRYLPLDFSEVSVTRRLHRSGDSEFFINKKNCRLKDIVELFMDSGLGKESFSIISQGKVEAIFNSKPEDRRGIFEEAAGVLKYKQRKHEAEKKLFETEDNLSRVQDIIYELQEQLTPLKVQAETAETYLTWSKELKNWDIGTTLLKIEQTQASFKEYQQGINSQQQKIEQVVAELTEKQKHLDKLKVEKNGLDTHIEQIQQQLLKTTEQLEQTEAKKQVLLERNSNTQELKKEYEERLNQLTATMQQYEEECQQLANDKEKQQQRYDVLQKEVAEYAEQVAFYSHSVKEQLAILRNDYIENMQGLATTNNEIKYLAKQWQLESAKNQDLLTKQQQLKEKEQQLQVDNRTLQQESQAQALALSQLTETFSKKEQALKIKRDTIKQQEQAIYQLMGQVQQTGARHKSLQEVKENYTGFYQGVRAILKQKAAQPGIIGAVAELVEVPEELSLGIETAMGASSQHIVVENEQIARQCITYLKEQRLGRGTFLPLTVIQGKSLPERVKEGLRFEPGYLGVASELIQYETKVAPIIQNILGRTLMAKDLASANRLAQQVRYQYRVVSLEGDVMNPGGAMTGGASKRGQKGGLFNQQHDLQRLEALLKSQQQQLKSLQTEREANLQQLQQLELGIEELRQAIHQGEMKQEGINHQLAIVMKEVKQSEREQQAFSFENHELQVFLQNYEQERDLLTKKKQTLEQEQAKLKKQMDRLEEQAETNSQKKEEVQQLYQEKQAKWLVSQEQLHHLTSRLTEKQQQLTKEKRTYQQLYDKLQVLTEDRVSDDESQEDLANKTQLLASQKQQLQEELLDQRQIKKQLVQTVEELENNTSCLQSSREELVKTHNQYEVKLNRSEVELDNLLVYLQEEYQTTYEWAKQQGNQVEDLHEGEKAVKQLREQIQGLGPVNIQAIEQYQQVNERYTFLSSQREDLLQAKDSLFCTMDEMDELVKERFLEVFNGIREKFQVVFPNMFGGGYADLRLTDKEDLLKTGVEIVAQPPGKKLQSLSLLSGGERALTAIALLFSIIQVRPVPFCVLDEVEAALDEANVSRFGQYLKNFENDTQFIVITHRKGTMEAADVLYGVTMQESGVSSIVSVRLDDVNKNETQEFV